MAKQSTTAEIIAAIDELLPVLVRARSHPQMYFDPFAPIQVIPWLHGLHTGYSRFQIHCPTELREPALKRRGLELKAIWEDERLLARGLTPEQVATVLLSIEIEQWQAYRSQLENSELKKSSHKPAKSSNCELTQSPAKRAAAAKQTAAIQDNFPRGLSQPALRALANAGFTKLEQLRFVPESELLLLHGMGPKGVKILKAALKGLAK